MSRMIEISEELYQDIVELAEAKRQPPDVFVEQSLREHIGHMLSASSLQSKIKERKQQLHKTLSSMSLGKSLDQNDAEEIEVCESLALASKEKRLEALIEYEKFTEDSPQT